MATVFGVAALLMAAAGCSTTSVAPDHSGAEASVHAPPGNDGAVEGGLDAGQAVPICMTSTDCMSGQICCATEAMTVGCQAGPCPYLPALGRSVQLCGSAADCFVAGDTCDDTRLPIKVCSAPIDDGGPSDAGQTDVASDGGLDARDDDAAADTGADVGADVANDSATDSGPADADACAPSGGCTAACVAGRHNVSIMVDGCLVTECCVLDDAGTDAGGG
jgi:hypothetical protein